MKELRSIYFGDEFPLLEMSMSKDKAELRIEGLGRQVLFHLVKVLYFEDTQNESKHIKDIDTWLNAIDEITLKPNNKKPKEKNLYDWMFGDVFESSPEHFKKTVLDKYFKEYESLPKKIDYRDLYIKVKKIFEILSKDLHQGELKTIAAYLEKI